jgi:hypothetical protein
MPLTYRRMQGSDTWHFRTDCAHWPRAEYDEERRTPMTGRCCFECTYWPATGATCDMAAAGVASRCART